MAGRIQRRRVFISRAKEFMGPAIHELFLEGVPSSRPMTAIRGQRMLRRRQSGTLEVSTFSLST
jgi:hypothetical protein